MSFEFDEAYYLKSKLAQLQASDSQYANWTTDQVKQAILDAGFADVQAHYNAYSLIEGTSGSPYFNTTEYLEAKVHQLNSMKEDGRTDWTVEDVIKAFQDAGFTNAEEHYNMYGCKETDADGKLINPSNAFDANAYVAAKLAELQATEPEKYADWTAEDVAEAIADAGLTPVSHFEEYGKAEGAANNIDMVQTVPVVERVANDQLRDAMGENVPSNYNAATPAPKSVTEGSSVAKPCDMGDEDTVKPSDPVATPADVNYVAVPANGIEDTNEKPVELVSASTQDAQGNEVTASQYGVTETAEDGSTTTKAVGTDGKVADNAATIKTVSADGNTTNTSVKQGSTEISQKAVTNGDTTTTTTNASLNGGSNTVTQNSTETKNADGSTTTATNTTVKNATGTTVSQESSNTTTSADGKSSTTETTTRAADGTVTETKTESSTAADGTVTNKTTGTETASDGTVTNIAKEETVSTAADGSKETKVEETKTDSDGNVVSQTSTTTTASRAADGTLTSETTGTTKDADGNVTTVNEKTETKTDPTTGTTTETKTVDNSTVDSEGNPAGSEKGTVESTVAADGSATKTTKMETTDADGNTTTTDTKSEYDAATNQTTTNGTVETKDSEGNVTETETKTNETTSGDTAGNSNTPAEQAAADEAGGTGEETKPDEPVTPAASTFLVINTDGALTFDGSATGDITIGGTAAALTFTRGGTKAEETFDSTEIKSLTKINDNFVGELAILEGLKSAYDASQKVALSDTSLDTSGVTSLAALSGKLTDGTVDASKVGTVTGDLNAFTNTLAGLKNVTYNEGVTFEVTCNGTVTANDIKAIKDIKDSADVTLKGKVDLSGSASDLGTMLKGVAIDSDATGDVTLTGATLDAADMENLSGLSGNQAVTASEATKLTGKLNELDAFSVIDTYSQTNVGVELQEDAKTEIALDDLKDATDLVQNSGKVTFANAVTITGLTAANSAAELAKVDVTGITVQLGNAEVEAADLQTFETAVAKATGIDTASGELSITTITNEALAATDAKDTFEVTGSTNGASFTAFNADDTDKVLFSEGKYTTAADLATIKTLTGEDAKINFAVDLEKGNIYYQADAETANWSNISDSDIICTIGVDKGTLDATDFA